MSIHDPDYDYLLRTNIERVFSERDPAKRARVIAEIYTDEPLLLEPNDIVRGRDNISQTVDKLLERFGPDFAFVPVGQANGHHGLGHLTWHAGPKSGHIAVIGADVAEIVDGRIARLWVLLDSPS